MGGAVCGVHLGWAGVILRLLPPQPTKASTTTNPATPQENRVRDKSQSSAPLPNEQHMYIHVLLLPSHLSLFPPPLPHVRTTPLPSEILLSAGIYVQCTLL